MRPARVQHEERAVEIDSDFEPGGLFDSDFELLDEIVAMEKKLTQQANTDVGIENSKRLTSVECDDKKTSEPARANVIQPAVAQRKPNADYSRWDALEDSDDEATCKDLQALDEDTQQFLKAAQAAQWVERDVAGNDDQDLGVRLVRPGQVCKVQAGWEALRRKVHDETRVPLSRVGCSPQAIDEVVDKITQQVEELFNNGVESALTLAEFVAAVRTSCKPVAYTKEFMELVQLHLPCAGTEAAVRTRDRLQWFYTVR